MRGFMKRKWHRIPVGLVLVALMTCLLVGSVFAYNILPIGGASVQVNEAITITCLNGQGSWDETTWVWTVTMYPGETRTVHLQFNNASSVPITVDPTVTPTGTELAVGFGSGTYEVPAGGSIAADLIATATVSCPPGTGVYTITISR